MINTSRHFGFITTKRPTLLCFIPVFIDAVSNELKILFLLFKDDPEFIGAHLGSKGQLFQTKMFHNSINEILLYSHGTKVITKNYHYLYVHLTVKQKTSKL